MRRSSPGGSVRGCCGNESTVGSKFRYLLQARDVSPYRAPPPGNHLREEAIASKGAQSWDRLTAGKPTVGSKAETELLIQWLGRLVRDSV